MGREIDIEALTKPGATVPVDIETTAALVLHALRLRDQIKMLRIRNASLVECLRASLCPYNGRTTGVTVAECQQCGCSHGLFIQPDAI